MGYLGRVGEITKHRSYVELSICHDRIVPDS